MMQRLLCPTDFSEPSEVALAEADAWAMSRGGVLTLLHVHPIVDVALVDFSYIQVPGQSEALQQALERRLATWRERLSTPKERVFCEVAIGSPIREITRRSKDFDLIVMGTHGRSGVGHFLLGSVAERVVAGAHCSVLIAKRQPLASKTQSTAQE